jgi:hypothetical protein
MDPDACLPTPADAPVVSKNPRPDRSLSDTGRPPVVLLANARSEIPERDWAGVAVT